MIKTWFQYGFDLLKSEKCYSYDAVKGNQIKPYIISNDNSNIENCSAILDDLKSFKGDLGLMRYLASKKGKYKIIENDDIKNYDNRIMNLYHFIDQHCCPNFAYFYISKNLPIDKVNPFGKIFKDVFEKITGINPRKEDMDCNDRFVNNTRNAQRLYLKWMMSDKEEKKEEKKEEETYSLDYILSDDYIPGLIGTIEVKNSLATLKRINDEFVIVAIKKPSRDSEDSTLSDKVYENVIKIVKEKLKDGIKIKIYPFKGKIITVKDLNVDNVSIDDKKWNKIKNLHYDIPYINSEMTLDQAIINNTNGIHKNAFEKLDEILDKKGEESNGKGENVIKRLVMYLTTKDNHIKMNDISRDGSGIHQAVSILDIEVFQILLKISLLFSFGLKLSTNDFKITNMFLLEKIKDYIIEKYIDTKNENITIKLKKNRSKYRGNIKSLLLIN